MTRGAIILAGGLSRRLGRPKQFIEVGGVPLLVRVVASVSEIADRVVVVTRGNMVSKIARLIPGIRVTRDGSLVRSPLVGLAAGAISISADYVAALPCDLPFLAPALLGRLFFAAKGRDAAIPRWPNGMIEPLVAVYARRPLLLACRNALRAGERSNQSMIDRLRRVQFVEVASLRSADPRLASFVNVNTRADLARARRMATRVAPPLHRR